MPPPSPKMSSFSSPDLSIRACVQKSLGGGGLCNSGQWWWVRTKVKIRITVTVMVNEFGN